MLQDYTKTLASVLRQQKMKQAEIDLLDLEVNRLRSMIRDEMISDGTKTHESNGIQAQIRTKKYSKVVNDQVLEDFLVKTGRADEYTVTRIDKVKAKSEGAKNNWPGIEVEERQELAIKEVPE